MNKVILVGNLGKDPELNGSTAPDKPQMAKMSVATTNYDGSTSWHSVICFGKTADNCIRYLQKGSKIAIDGRIQYNSYEKDGNMVYFTNIVASNIQFLSSPNRREDNNVQPDILVKDNFSDDIPF